MRPALEIVLPLLLIVLNVTAAVCPEELRSRLKRSLPDVFHSIDVPENFEQITPHLKNQDSKLCCIHSLVLEQNKLTGENTLRTEYWMKVGSKKVIDESESYTLGKLQVGLKNENSGKTENYTFNIIENAPYRRVSVYQRPKCEHGSIFSEETLNSPKLKNEQHSILLKMRVNDELPTYSVKTVGFPIFGFKQHFASTGPTIYSTFRTENLGDERMFHENISPTVGTTVGNFETEGYSNAITIPIDQDQTDSVWHGAVTDEVRHDDVDQVTNKPLLAILRHPMPKTRLDEIQPTDPSTPNTQFQSTNVPVVQHDDDTIDKSPVRHTGFTSSSTLPSIQQHSEVEHHSTGHHQLLASQKLPSEQLKIHEQHKFIEPKSSLGVKPTIAYPIFYQQQQIGEQRPQQPSLQMNPGAGHQTVFKPWPAEGIRPTLAIEQPTFKQFSTIIKSKVEPYQEFRKYSENPQLSVGQQHIIPDTQKPRLTFEPLLHWQTTFEPASVWQKPTIGHQSFNEQQSTMGNRPVMEMHHPPVGLQPKLENFPGIGPTRANDELPVENQYLPENDEPSEEEQPVNREEPHNDETEIPTNQPLMDQTSPLNDQQVPSMEDPYSLYTERNIYKTIQPSQSAPQQQLNIGATPLVSLTGKRFHVNKGNNLPLSLTPNEIHEFVLKNTQGQQTQQENSTEQYKYPEEDPFLLYHYVPPWETIKPLARDDSSENPVVSTQNPPSVESQSNQYDPLINPWDTDQKLGFDRQENPTKEIFIPSWFKEHNDYDRFTNPWDIDQRPGYDIHGIPQPENFDEFLGSLFVPTQNPPSFGSQSNQYDRIIKPWETDQQPSNDSSEGPSNDPSTPPLVKKDQPRDDSPESPNYNIVPQWSTNDKPENNSPDSLFATTQNPPSSKPQTYVQWQQGPAYLWQQSYSQKVPQLDYQIPSNPEVLTSPTVEYPQPLEPATKQKHTTLGQGFVTQPETLFYDAAHEQELQIQNDEVSKENKVFHDYAPNNHYTTTYSSTTFPKQPEVDFSAGVQYDKDALMAKSVFNKLLKGVSMTPSEIKSTLMVESPRIGKLLQEALCPRCTTTDLSARSDEDDLIHDDILGTLYDTGNFHKNQDQTVERTYSTYVPTKNDYYMQDEVSEGIHDLSAEKNDDPTTPEVKEKGEKVEENSLCSQNGANNGLVEITIRLDKLYAGPKNAIHDSDETIRYRVTVNNGTFVQPHYDGNISDEWKIMIEKVAKQFFTTHKNEIESTAPNYGNNIYTPGDLLDNALGYRSTNSPYQN